MVISAPGISPRKFQTEREEIGSKDLHDPRKLNLVYEAIKEANTKARHFKATRREFVKQVAGHYYLPDNEKRDLYQNPVNLLRMTANVYTRHLAANNPRAQIIPRDERLWADAVDLEAAINQTIIEMDLRETLSMCTLDAMFCCGIAIVGTEATDQEVLVDGEYQTVSNLLVDWVDFEDFIQDMGVRRWRDRSFCGHKFRRPLYAARKDDSYEKSAKKELVASERQTVDELGEEDISTIGAGGAAQEDYLYEEVELYYLHFPREEKVAVIPVQQVKGKDQTLAVYDWEGPPGGPYHRLSMMELPGNMMPLSPLTGIADLHYLQNNLWRKLTEQAKTAKKIGVVAGGANKDGKNIMECPDGQVISVQRPDAAREMNLGGIQPETLAFSFQIQNMFSWMAGNINSLGGLSPEADTLGQEKLLSASASKQVAEMSDRVTRFARGILESLVWWEMRDELREVQTSKRIPGTDIDMPVTVRPAEMLPDEARFRLEVYPFSMRDRSPEARLQSLLQYFQFVIMPNVPLMAQQGITVEFEKVMRLIARQADLPEIEHILHFTGKRPEEQPSSRNESAAAPVKRTENVRTNQSSGSQESQNMATIQSLLDGKRGSQTDAANRMVG